MKDDALISTLQRKAGAGRPRPEPTASSIEGLFRKAVAQAAEDLDQLVATLERFGESQGTLADLLTDLPDTTLLMTLQAPDGRRALATVDIQLVTALVEHLTTARIVPQAATPRRPTRTDAVMVSDFLDRMLCHFDRTHGLLVDAPPVTGFRFATVLAEPRMIQMALADTGYRAYRLRIDLGRGARAGEVLLAFPMGSTQSGRQLGTDDADWQDALSEAVMRAEVPVRAVLHRVMVPLTDISEWAVDHLLELPSGSLTSVELEGMDGRVAATVKLGQIGGMRAIRIGAPGALANRRSTSQLARSSDGERFTAKPGRQ